MRIDTRWILPVALGFALALPSSVWAQGRGNANGHGKSKARNQPARVIVQDDDDDRWDDRDGNDRRRNDSGSIVLRDGARVIVLDRDDFAWFPVRNDGPAFCRSGAGHPVWGIQWCLNKGYSVGRPGTWFLRGDDLFLRDQSRVIVLQDRAYDADRAFWGAVASQIFAWLN